MNITHYYNLKLYPNYYEDSDRLSAEVNVQMSMAEETGVIKIDGVRFGKLKINEKTGEYHWSAPKKRDDKIFRFDRVAVSGKDKYFAVYDLIEYINSDTYFSSDILEWINNQKYKIPGEMKEM